MKKAFLIVTILLFIFTGIKPNYIYADSLDEYSYSFLNGVENDVLDMPRSSIKIEAGSAEIKKGVVGAGGATITVTVKDGYSLEKVTVYSKTSTDVFTTATIILTANLEITEIEVAVVDTVNAYNKPINVSTTKFNYGLKLDDINVTTCDSDLQLVGKNLFYDYSLTPVDSITKPGIYELLMVFDSDKYEHFPGDYNHNYLNTVTIEDSYYFEKQVVNDYNLQYATKNINLTDDSQNFYLFLFAYYYLPGKSVEYFDNAKGDIVNNMPTNEIDAYLPGATVIINNIDIPCRDGYIFGGWSLSEDGDAVSEVSMPEGGLKLYAIWNKIPVMASTSAVSNSDTTTDTNQPLEDTKVEHNEVTYKFVNTGD